MIFGYVVKTCTYRSVIPTEKVSFIEHAFSFYAYSQISYKRSHFLMANNIYHEEMAMFA